MAPAKLQFADLEAVGPGTPAGRYLRLFWQPVMRAKDLPPGRAKPLEMLGEICGAHGCVDLEMGGQCISTLRVRGSIGQTWSAESSLLQLCSIHSGMRSDIVLSPTGEFES